MASLRTPPGPRSLPAWWRGGRPHVAWRRVRPEWIFALLAPLATAWLMYKGRHFTFQNDEWDWILHRRGLSAGVFLRPHGEHLSALPIAVYKVLLALFGARSTFPFRLVDAVLASACAGLLFVLVARRLGGWVALAPSAVLLLLGPGWNDILWGFQMGYLFSVAAGLGTLLVLERRDRGGDVLAAVLLTVAIAASSVGIMVLVGALVLIASSLRASSWRRLWVVAVPALLYLLWYSRYGVSSLRLSYVHLVPLYAFDGLSAVLGSLTGLTAPDNGPYQATLDPGTTLAALLLVALVARFLLGGPLSRRFWAAGAIALGFWVAAALDYIPGREANSSRYIYAVAPFVILLIAESARGWRPPRARGLMLLYLAAIAALVSNLSFLNQGADLFDVTSVFARGELGAMQVARGVVSPAFQPESSAISAIVGIHNLIPIDAGSYFAAVDRFGSPADTVTQLLRAPESVREAADLVLAKAERIDVSTVASDAGAVCVERVPSGGTVGLSSGPGTLLLDPQAARPSQIALRRFAAAEHYVVFNPLPLGRRLAITLPADRAAGVPWHADVFTNAPVRVCRRSLSSG